MLASDSLMRRLSRALPERLSSCCRPLEPMSNEIYAIREEFPGSRQTAHLLDSHTPFAAHAKLPASSASPAEAARGGRGGEWRVRESRDDANGIHAGSRSSIERHGNAI